MPQEPSLQDLLDQSKASKANKPSIFIHAKYLVLAALAAIIAVSAYFAVVVLSWLTIGSIVAYVVYNLAMDTYKERERERGKDSDTNGHT